MFASRVLPMTVGASVVFGQACAPKPTPNALPETSQLAPATPTAATGSSSANYSVAPTPSRSFPQGGSMWILADTQFHHIEGKPFYDEISDGFVEVAIRPPALDLFAPAVLASVIKTMSARPERPIFFLGDGANVSCIDEYDRFLATMGSAPWLGVLGNHDGYFIGNNVDKSGVSRNWKLSCANGPQDRVLLDRLAAWEKARFGKPENKTYARYNAMSKATAVAMYLIGLQRRGVIKFDPLRDCSDQQFSDCWSRHADDYWHFTTSFELSVESESLLVALEAVVASGDVGEGDNEWDAYLLQNALIRSRKTHVILADTSDYESRPTSHIKIATARCWANGRCNVPGTIGNVAQAQADTIMKWVERAQKDGEDFFLMGHHNWDSLSKQTLGRLKKAENSVSFITYVSGHEHDPTSKVKAEGAREDWEVNVASVTDYPQQFASIAYEPTIDQNTKATRLEVTAYDVASMRPVADGSDVSDPGSPARCAVRTKPECEINYSPNAQTCYFGGNYHRQVREITKLMIERLLRDPGLIRGDCDRKCLEQKYKKIDSLEISEVTLLVRDKLMQSDWIKEQAFACAVQAACFERKYRCGSSFLANRVARIKSGKLTAADIEKTPVEAGTAITKDTGVFTVHRGPQW